MYLVLAMKHYVQSSALSTIIEAPFSSAGFVGVCPVFATREEAEAWADGKAEVVSITATQKWVK